jgi:hypothetical protein
MMPIMVISKPNKYRYELDSTIHSCPNHPNPPPMANIPKDETIDVFYSDIEALKNGWSTTNDLMYSPDGDWIWICPKCTERRKGVPTNDL